jgi:CheY-like chemotaxis protein
MGMAERDPHPQRVLIVDDDPLSRLLLTNMLAALDCQVDEAAGGAEALALLEQREFSRMLMDVHMPGLDGFELAAKVRASPGRNREIPIVAVSGDISRTLKQYRQIGIDGVIEKPVSFRSIRAGLETVRHDGGRSAES